MHIAAYIVLALAFGISNMLLFCRCAEATPIRLSRGLVLTLATAALQTIMFILGMLAGDILRFELPDSTDAFTKANALIFFGLYIIVILRMLKPYLRKEPRLPLFNLGSNKVAIALALTAAVNPLFLGLGAGFVASVADMHMVWLALILIPLWLAGYWGLMLGRQKVAIRPRRWMIVASILMLGVGIAALVNA